MNDETDVFLLNVQVPAEEWAYAKRRAIYLEAVLVQLLADRDRLQEWYDAREIAALRLPGLPTSKAALTRLARAQGWLCREVIGKGGVRYEYHYASFPARAFDALIGRILNISHSENTVPTAAVPEIEPTPEPVVSSGADDNTAPPWVLPFMRLLRGSAKGNIAAAWRALPLELPASVRLPTREEAAETIIKLGLAKNA